MSDHLTTPSTSPRSQRRKRSHRFHPSRVGSQISLAEFVALAAQLCPDDPAGDIARCRAWQALSRTEEFLNLGAEALDYVAEHGTVPPPPPPRESEHERNARLGQKLANAFLPLSNISLVRRALNAQEIRKVSELEIVEAVADDAQLEKWVEAFVKGTPKNRDHWKRVGSDGDSDLDAIHRADVPYLAIYIKSRAPRGTGKVVQHRRGSGQGHPEALAAARASYDRDHPFEENGKSSPRAARL